MTRRPRALAPLAALALAAAACAPTGDPAADPTTTDGAPAAGSAPTGTVPVEASATVAVTGVPRGGPIPFVQDPARRSTARAEEGALTLHLVDPANPTRRLSIGGAARAGQPTPTSTRLTVSYLGDGIVLASSDGGCTLTLSRFDETGLEGSLACPALAAGGGGTVAIDATLSAKPAPAPATAPGSPPTTASPPDG